MISQREYVRLKGRLTRAKNSADPRKVVAEVRYAVAIFNAEGWPDSWPNWRIALDDAAFTLERTLSSVDDPRALARAAHTFSEQAFT